MNGERRTANGERRTPSALSSKRADVMEVRWDRNEKPTDQVKKEPSDRQASNHAEGGLEPLRCPATGFDRGGFPLKAIRA